MAADTIHSDFGAPESHCFHFFPICHEVMEPNGMILVFWMLSFKPAFSFSSFTFKRIFSSSSLSASRMVSSACLRLLIFLLPILIPTCDSSSLPFYKTYSPYKLNQQGDNIQAWCTPSPILNKSIVQRPVLTVASWPAYRLLRRKLRWSGISISLRIFHSLLLSTVKDFSVVNKAEADVFLEPAPTCFLHNPMNAGNLISGSSVSLKLRLYIWKFSVQMLLKPSL